MTKKRRTETWLALIAATVGLLLVAFLGLWAYLSATPPLHPNPQDVPSVTASAPLPTWGAAVAQGRQIVRASLIEQNLPGLSVPAARSSGPKALGLRIRPPVSEL